MINKKPLLRERNILIEEGFDYIIKLNMTNAISYFQTKWAENTIKESDDSKANKLFKNQRQVKKYKNH